MTFRITVAAITTMVLLALGRHGIGAPLQSKTQWSGVYTAEQGKRGEELYSKYCTRCHGADLGGGGVAPSLTGSEFSANWNDLSLGDLFEQTRVTMPKDAPGSLSPQQNADILAFMLLKGSVPPGQTELSDKIEDLNTIKFIGQQPSH
jgi:mono/diheme cytochrome c family protein